MADRSLSLYPHQVTGVEWLAPRRRALLADEMGLGKSITAIVAAKKAGVKHMLVLAPSVVAWNWHRELQKWWPEMHAAVCVGVDSFFKAFYGERKPDVVIITHTGVISKLMFEAICKTEWDLVVLDESHYFRNESAQRTRAFYGSTGVVHRAKRVWLLTGTPMPNNAGELWPMLRGLWPDRCPYTYEQFREKFCHLQWSTLKNDWKIVGNKDVPGLKKLMAGIFLRRLKKDHLDLPPIRWETVVLPAPVPTAAMLNMAEALQDAPEDDALLDFLRQHTEFAEWRRLCGESKIDSAGEMLSMELEAGLLKVVVFAHHLSVLEGLARRLVRDGYEAVTITGEVSAKDRQTAVEQFQADPAVRVALCQLQAGGVGVTLTAASEVVFVECSFVPADNSQAADRCHRIGQTEQVRVRFLALADSVDQLVTETLARKSSMIAEVLGEKSAK